MNRPQGFVVGIQVIKIQAVVSTEKQGKMEGTETAEQESKAKEKRKKAEVRSLTFFFRKAR